MDLSIVVRLAVIFDEERREFEEDDHVSNLLVLIDNGFNRCLYIPKGVAEKLLHIAHRIDKRSDRSPPIWTILCLYPGSIRNSQHPKAPNFFSKCGT